MRTQKRLAITLFVSIALNLFLAGMLTTLLIRSDGFGDRDGRKFGRFDRDAAMAVLSENSRDKVQSIWRNDMSGMREEAKARRGLRREMHEILVADNFDRARFETTSRSYHEKSAKMHTAMSKAIAETAAVLSSDERKKYFSISMRKHKKRHKN
jgi:uncharacterized membrane protein